MTEEEKTAMKAVLYLAKKNPRLRYGGTWVEDVYNMGTCQKMPFMEAVRIVEEMLYGPIEEVNNDDYCSRAVRRKEAKK